MKGFLLQFVNIKIYMFGITALTGFITPYSKALCVGRRIDSGGYGGLFTA
jgi:threonine/homoserine/homoserine lactone efflux protein